jgi:hypothetical protein
MKTVNYFLLACALCTSGSLLSQNDKQIPSAVRIPAGDAFCSPVISIECSGLKNTPSADLQWLPGLSYKVQESEPMEPNHEKIEKMREEITRMKMQGQGQGQSETGTERETGTAGTLSVVPTIGVNYIANKFDGWNPMDNNIAISNKGIIVSVANASVEVDDSTGKNLYSNTLNTFINDATIPNACDPQIFYDARADRFLAYCQEIPATAGGPNHMLFFFSKTNNPATGGWYYYKLSGNPLNDGSWADYPKLAVNDNNIFLSSNLFSSSGTFNQAILWQIEKTAAYSGGTLNSKLWSGFTAAPFTLLPVSEGHGHSFGPGIWMVSTANGGGSTLELYKITDDLSGSPTVTHSTVNTTAYTVCGNSNQKGTSAQLKILDCRCMNGFYLNGIIHFVFNSGDASGNTGINYNRLDVNAKTNSSKLLSASNTDYGYPGVASYSVTDADKSVMIGFSQANSNIYPEVDVVNCDDGMTFSAITPVKSSDGYVSGSGTQRWGDYSGMCRKHNVLQPCVWMAGAYGTSSNNWNAYVAQIFDASYVTGVQEQSPLARMNVFPNPVVDNFSLEFDANQTDRLTISLYDMGGKLVKELYNGPCYGGECLFSFNKSNLSKGIYSLILRDNKEVIHREKIAIAE